MAWDFSNIDADEVLSVVEADENLGYCLSCGGDAHGCEPDMRKGHCEHCGDLEVYGAQELLLMGACG
ncbi:hypothetical protein SAMN05216227_102028 [Pseudorhodobacter antarcticus]|uniref:Uncharacterized protein n=1 Tax=Pseudorhodobacter antarcticus TaxID=1077947 RepID=A0A1H8IGF2_9RHOB|nr:hypothetical protein [Pseudorhodobacter antarcticus]SEN67359.1 hypothetical protein SAMN05216227_102028 [Pseudorhodobacter antarcticus]